MMKRTLFNTTAKHTSLGFLGLMALSSLSPVVGLSVSGSTTAGSETGSAKVSKSLPQARKNSKTKKVKVKIVSPATTAETSTKPVILNLTSRQNSELRKVLLVGDWDKAVEYPAFIEFVRSYTGKNLESIDSETRVTIWPELLTHLDRVTVADANYVYIKQGAVSEELKGIFSRIDHSRGDYDYSEVNRILQVFRNKHKVIGTDLARIDFLQGQVFELRKNYTEAERYYKNAVTNDEKEPLYVYTYAKLLQVSGKYAESELLYRRLLDIRVQLLGKEHLEVAGTLNDLAKVLTDQSKYSEAEPLLRQALTIYEVQFGKEDPRIAFGLNNLSGLLNTQGRYADAEPLYRRLLDLREKSLGKDNLGVAVSLKNLAGLLDAEGKFAESEPLYRRALAIDERIYGKEHSEVATDLNNLASSLKMQAKSAEAEPLYRRSLDIRQKAMSKDLNFQK